MGLLDNDFTKTATAISKVIKLLDEYNGKVRNGDDVYTYKDDFCFIAYFCRYGILDRIEKHNWPQNGEINIVFSLFKIKKITLAEALMLTVGTLKKIVEDDSVTADRVEQILQKNSYFYEIDKMFTKEQKKQF